LKKLSAIFAILVVLFAVTNSFAQPQVVVHVTGGYNLPMGDLKGDISTFLTDPAGTNNAYQKSGFNVGADGKYFLGKKRNVGITLSAGYNAFSSGTNTFADNSTLVLKVNDFAVGLGAEYDFMPKGKTNPFIGVEFVGNFISGKGTFTSAGGTATDNTLNSASRFGIQGNLGLDFAFSKSVGAVLGLRYNLVNLIGKKSDTTGETSTSSNLKDAAYTQNGVSYNAANYSYLTIYAGVSFFFNRPKIMKK